MANLPPDCGADRGDIAVHVAFTLESLAEAPTKDQTCLNTEYGLKSIFVCRMLGLNG
jgi:hypothetical protein